MTFFLTRIAQRLIRRWSIRLAGYRLKLSADTIRFLVVVPTVRHSEMASIYQQLIQTAQYPTDWLCVDGRDGKAQALNDVLKGWVDPKQHTFFATIDDDVIMPPNWQQTVVDAFQQIPNLGSVGLDYHVDDPTDDITGGQTPIHQEGSVQYRYPVSNVPGGNIIMPVEIALCVGPIPCVKGIRYCHYDDGWRHTQIKHMGLKSVLLVTQAKVKLVGYSDTLDYMTLKVEDREKSHQLKASGFKWFWVKVKALVS